MGNVISREKVDFMIHKNIKSTFIYVAKNRTFQISNLKIQKSIS